MILEQYSVPEVLQTRYRTSIYAYVNNLFLPKSTYKSNQAESTRMKPKNFKQLDRFLISAKVN